MTTGKTKLLTADDLLRMYGQRIRGELVRGVLCETVSTGMEHGQIAAKFVIRLGIFIEPKRLGRLTTSDSGVWLERDPDTVREPDVAFTSAERLPLNVRVRGYSEVVPDLVVEIVSPSDSMREVHEKAEMWLRFGVTVVWVADPDTRTIAVYQSGVPVTTLTENDTLDGAPVLPGFTLLVRDIFDLE
jgi:Uma2 family endonuclease